MAMNPTGLSDIMGTTNWNPINARQGGNPPMANPIYQTPGTGTGGPGNYNFGSAANPNPTGPSTSMFPGGGWGGGVQTGGSTGFVSGNPFNFGQNTDPKGLQSKLSDVFGSGLGNFISAFLTSGGGYNSALTQQNVDATIANLQHQIQTGYGNLQNELGAQGVSPASSVNALESSNYMAQAVNQENQITAQMFYDMWNQSMNRETSILGGAMGSAATHQGKAGDWAGQFAEFGQGLSSIMGGGMMDFTL